MNWDQMEKVHQKALNLNDLDSIESHLLFLGVDDSDQPKASTESRIQHKIDAKNIEMIKWSKLQSLISDMINQNNFCLYELRIYNGEIQNESITQILSNIKSISTSLNSTSEIIKMKQDFEQAILQSEEVSYAKWKKRPWYQKLSAFILNLFAPLF